MKLLCSKDFWLGFLDGFTLGPLVRLVKNILGR